MARISVILATFNEERNIKACLESVEWADEIVIVDGTSRDKTVQIAKKYTSKIFVRENPLMFHKNKQLAIEKATGDWILYLDADERVTPELKKEVRGVIRETRYEGFWIPRKNIIFGKWIEHTGWYPDYQLRLFRRGKGFLPCKSVHEQPRVEGQIGHLKNPLIHYNYRTVSQFINKLNNLYTENDRNVFLTSGKKIKWSDAFRWPTAEFLRRFFQQQGYKDGLHGLVLSLLQAFSFLVTFAKIWETEKFRPVASLEIEPEFKRASHEFRFWLLTSKIDISKNFFKKICYQIRRKLI